MCLYVNVCNLNSKYQIGIVHHCTKVHENPWFPELSALGSCCIHFLWRQFWSLVTGTLSPPTLKSVMMAFLYHVPAQIVSKPQKRGETCTKWEQLQIRFIYSTKKENNCQVLPVFAGLLCDQWPKPNGANVEPLLVHLCGVARAVHDKTRKYINILWKETILTTNIVSSKINQELYRTTELWRHSPLDSRPTMML